MNFLTDFILETWNLIAEMAPYLIIGFLVAGALSVLIKQETIQRWLGNKGVASVFWGSLLGVPLPLCSCGVIPVSSSLYRRGASKGATVSFLTSTPQTGVDSIMATTGMMGPFFALFRVVVALVSGIASGILVNLLDDENEKQTDTNTQSPTSSHTHPKPMEAVRSALHYGLYTLPADLGRNLIIGLVLAGLLGVIIPDNWFSQFLDQAWLAYAAVTLIAIPIYVCSTGSIPIAFTLMAAGVSPGAALVFLIAGPATNVATITTLTRVLGRKTMLIYIGVIIAFSWGAGALLDAIPTWQNWAASGVHHHETHIAWWKHASGVFLMLTLLFPLISSRLNAKNEPMESSNNSLTLHVSGMNCGHCSASLTKALLNVPGVSDAKVDHQQERAWVEGDHLDLDALRLATEEVGFQFHGKVD